MPFTLSHPAAVLPLRRYGVFSALFFGSMSPDYLYFIPGQTYASFGHTIHGLYLFCLPATMVALWTFHRLMKRPLSELLPEGIAARLRPAIHPFDFGIWPLDVTRLAAVIVSILGGAVTHIVWDSATHINGFVADAIPALMSPLFSDSRGTVLRIQLAQEASTVLGAAILIVAFRRWLRDASSSDAGGLRLPAWLKLLLPIVMAVATLAYTIPKALGPIGYQLSAYLNWEFFLRVSVILGMRTFFLMLLAYCIVWQALAARRPSAPPAG